MKKDAGAQERGNGDGSPGINPAILNLQTKRKLETESTLPIDPTEVMEMAKHRAGLWCVPPPRDG